MSRTIKSVYYDGLTHKYYVDYLYQKDEYQSIPYSELIRYDEHNLPDDVQYWMRSALQERKSAVACLWIKEPKTVLC